MPLARLLPIALLCACLSASAFAQTDVFSPAEFLGYELGSRFTPHHRVLDYVGHVAEGSDHVRMEPYGETYEGRPLVVLYVSSPENLARLSHIRANNVRMAGMAGRQAGVGGAGTAAGRPAAAGSTGADAAAGRLAAAGSADAAAGRPAAAGSADVGTGSADAPVIVWLSYNVHGNESVSTEAAMETLYELVVGPARSHLNETVVIIDPAVNPDGRERYVQWFNQTVGSLPNAAPEAREHREPWPGGRTNHYYFDLNRDWAWMVQAETQQRIPLYNSWMPHVHVDFHEQSVDAPYYFAPAAEPLHADITDWQRSFQTDIGLRHTRQFDTRGWLYFTREVFDLFYPGYGDTWPTFNGAVGMTYEQAGSGRAGLAVVTSVGDTLTLRDRIDRHVTTGLSTVETAARSRGEVVDAFRRYFESARTSPPGPHQGYLIKTAAAPGRGAALAAHLAAQGIEFGFAERDGAARGLHYGTGAMVRAEIQPGDLVVPAAQPKAVLTKVLLEPRASLPDSVTYDITAWSLPFAYGLDAFALTEPFPHGAARTQSTPALPATLPYAYLAEWQSLDDVRFLAELLREGIRPRVAMKPFAIEGRAYAAGTLIITRAGNENTTGRLDDVVRAAAAKRVKPVFPVTTGFVTRGADFGSSDVRPLKRLRAACLAGRGLSSYAVGEVWHYFDRQIEYPLTLLDTDAFRPSDLAHYDLLILPDGSYERVLDEERLSALKAWIEAGGRLIALEGAAEFLVGKDGFAIERRKTDDAPADTTVQRLRRFGDRERAAASEGVPGSIHPVQMDATHPLGFGSPETYHTLKRSETAFEFLKDGWNVGVLREAEPVSGFAGAGAMARLEDTLVFGVQEMGKGQVMYLVDNPLFRGFWYGGKVLFGSAVFLVGQ